MSGADSSDHPLRLLDEDTPSSPPLMLHKRHLFKNMKYNQRSQIEFSAVETFHNKANILRNSLESPVNPRHEDPSCDHHLTWREPPTQILLMKKFCDNEVTVKFKEIAKWLIEVQKVTVFCEPSVRKDSMITEQNFKPICDKLKTWDENTKEDVLSKIDLIICIGGDGTLLYTSSMFQNNVPPIVSFNMGSLGFLTPFPLDDYQVHIKRVFEGRVSITMRHRLVCEIRAQHTLPLRTTLPDDEYCMITYDRDSPLTPAATKPRMPTKFSAKILIPQEDLKTKMQVMNEVVIDRGPSPYLTNLELFCNGRAMTNVQGDGVIIATPTGSTAYSLAAGASMVHPSVPCMVISPICPHSLSFRSIVVPAGVEISVRVSPESRNSAWVAFDGRHRQEVTQGDTVVVTTSTTPVPSVNNTGHVTDWFDSLAECLQWNVRKIQKHIK